MTNPSPTSTRQAHLRRQACTPTWRAWRPESLRSSQGKCRSTRSGASVGVGDVAAQVNQVFANLGGILKDLGSGFD